MGTGAPQGGMSPQQQAQQMLPPGGIMGALPQGSTLGQAFGMGQQPGMGQPGMGMGKMIPRPQGGMGQPGMGMGKMIPRPQGGSGLASFMMQQRGGR
jgi:hypothetical protein